MPVSSTSIHTHGQKPDVTCRRVGTGGKFLLKMEFDYPGPSVTVYARIDELERLAIEIKDAIELASCESNANVSKPETVPTF